MQALCVTVRDSGIVYSHKSQQWFPQAYVCDYVASLSQDSGFVKALLFKAIAGDIKEMKRHELAYYVFPIPFPRS